MKNYILYLLFAILFIVFTAMSIDLQNLFNYSSQTVPTYITKDNSDTNVISDEGATLGRVLFYDKNLSSDNTISCASCHLQEFAFGDTSIVSQGVNGVTGRHSMRLVNNRFSDDVNLFWDRRANSLEDQTTMPIRDHIEMGFSGMNGDLEFNDLLVKLDDVSYYNDLFLLAFGDTVITEYRMQLAIAQFIRSIQSFDSPYDIGKAQVGHDSLPFPNFSQGQNNGKSLFITPPVFNNNSLRIGGGLGCASCHRPPEFDIDPNSKSNGVVFTPGSTNPNGGIDSIVFRSPSLRDVVNQDGQVNGRLMHTANFNNLNMVLNHYNRINLFPQVQGLADAIDERLIPNGIPQNLDMTNQERNQVIAFLGMLTGSNIYTDEKWSNPFNDDETLTIINGTSSTSSTNIGNDIVIFPNPTSVNLNLKGLIANTDISLFDIHGKMIYHFKNSNLREVEIQLDQYNEGIYFLRVVNQKGEILFFDNFLKN